MRSKRRNELGLFLMFLITSLWGCGPANKKDSGVLSNLVGLSETEDAGIKDIIKLYGGKCTYSVGKNISIGGSNDTYFEIKVSESEGVANFSSELQFVAHNIAYLFYHNLTEKEKEKYSYIKIVIVYPENKASTFKVDAWELSIVDNKMKLVNTVVDIIKSNQFDDLLPMLNDSSLVSYNKDQLLDSLRKYDEQYGDITSAGFQSLGYKFQALDDKGNDALYIAGIIYRVKEPTQFSIILDPYSKEQEVYMLQYAW